MLIWDRYEKKNQAMRQGQRACVEGYQIHFLEDFRVRGRVAAGEGKRQFLHLDLVLERVDGGAGRLSVVEDAYAVVGKHVT